MLGSLASCSLFTSLDGLRGGDGGALDAATTTCAADLTSDPKNCGACGHDCLDGACQNGRCQPVVLQPPSSQHAAAIAVDDTYVYWADNYGATIYRANKRDGSANQVVVSGVPDPRMIVADGSDLFIAVNGDNAIWKASKDGTQAATLLAPIGETYVTVLALDATTVFFSATGGIWAGSRAGGTPVKIRSLSRPTAIAVDTDLLWGDSHGYYRVPLAMADAGSAPFTVASYSTGGTLAAIDQDNAYLALTGSFPCFDDSSILQVVKAAAPSPRITLATGEHDIVGIAVDDHAVYWAAHGVGTCNDAAPPDDDGAIKSVPIGGGPITVYADNLAGPLGIALDDANIYYTLSNSGSVSRIAK